MAIRAQGQPAEIDRIRHGLRDMWSTSKEMKCGTGAATRSESTNVQQLFAEIWSGLQNRTIFFALIFPTTELNYSR
jgi:hypothetical protein